MAAYYDYDRPSPRPSSGSSLAPILLILLLIELGAVAAWWFWPRSSGKVLNPDATERPVAARGNLAEDEQSTIALYKKALPSVVHITTLGQRRDPFTLDVEQVPEGTGSGFVWDKDGHVVTNFHVVQKAGAFQVTLWDHSSYPATLVGGLPDKDLAVLSIGAPKDKLFPIEIGSSSDLQVGQKAFAIGNPFGLDGTLTTGIISALDREIQSVNGRTIKGVIQTNAAINPGNSGGPLLDSAGRLIGVNTAIISPSGASAGIGFAIPVDEVNRVVTEIIRFGKVTRPGLGLQVATDQLAKKAGVDGVLILKVQPDGAADQAGLQPTRRGRQGQVVFGDVIKAVNGKPVHTTNELFSLLEGYKVGEKVKLTVERGDQQLDVDVTLQAVS
jgi:S1-C subfamily serine protease